MISSLNGQGQLQSSITEFNQVQLHLAYLSKTLPVSQYNKVFEDTVGVWNELYTHVFEELRGIRLKIWQREILTWEEAIAIVAQTQLGFYDPKTQTVKQIIQQYRTLRVQLEKGSEA